MNASAAVRARAWCTFRLGERHYGVELARVQEVLKPLPVTRLPLAPPAVVGLVNLRGRIVPVVDPRVVLGGEAAPSAAAGLVVVRGAEGPVALEVDAIGDVRHADASAPPPSLPAEASVVAFTLAFPDELLVVLDLDRVLARAFAAPGASS